VSYFLINVAHQVYPATWILYSSYRYGWTVKQGAISLALVGLMAVIVQGGLSRTLIPKWGEKKAALIALSVNVFAYLCYGLATEGWMIFPVIVIGSLGGLAAPAIQGITANCVGNNEQGGLQGMLSSLVGISGIVGPLIATTLFGFFISDKAPMQLPGAAFFCSSFLVAIAIALAARSYRKTDSTNLAN
jgi:DHA1 family tetracycline resistance protein-like MFS transporter